MARVPRLVALLLAVFATAATDVLAQVRLADRATRIQQAQAGPPLTPPSSASPESIVADYLRGRGHGDATARSIVLVSSRRSPATGLTHLRFVQRVGELDVYGVYVKASLTPRGELVSVIENLVPVPAASVVDPGIGHAQALAAALRHLFGDAVAPPGLLRREGGRAVFQRTPFFHRNPQATAVAVPRTDGLLGTAFLVETWTDQQNLLHHTLVGGRGEVLNVELRTNQDSYNVFAVDPSKSPQTIVAGEAGWLDVGAHRTVHITGNNAAAYLDADANNTPDAGGTTVEDGAFTSVADLSADPAVDTNRAVAVQNLFYLNNVIHDRLYAAGFSEGAGNFQQAHFTSEGGLPGDRVNAEAQDGSGTDNANFATPPDGTSPRMQMFLWTPVGFAEVLLADLTFSAQPAAFGPSPGTGGVTGPLVPVDDVASNSDACGKLPRGSLAGAVALVDRGNCDFTVKVKNAQAAGAIAVIFANNQPTGLLTPGGSAGGLRIPAVLVAQESGAALRSAAQSPVTIRLKANPPPRRDSALDSDVVWHEYGHGLTWRMIGGMSGPIAGAIGEGMSDVLAVVVNDDDVVGEYSASSPLGIRSAPYSAYTRTYGELTGESVHFDGEIYGAIGWRLWQHFKSVGRTQDELLAVLVEGMNFTPETPTFEAMRDGILQAVGSTSSTGCLVWDAFAQYGVGVGASATVRGRKPRIVESFVRPAACTAGLQLTSNAND
ncbi:MAG TPA: M36 family metallopeptidase [Vicinamibacterales bacterium]